MMTEFHGFMFSKLHLIGSRSEGPIYYLQLFDYTEIHVMKQAYPWSEDPVLQKMLGRKVTITGKHSGQSLLYETVVPYVRTRNGAVEEPGLNVRVIPESREIQVNKMPPSPPVTPLKITLEVEWPFRSIWKGLCPTSQIYDFFVEFDGKTIWQWSAGKCFSQGQTTVSIPGGSPQPFTETWFIDPDTIGTEGTYKVRAIFVASGQEVEEDIEIRIAV